MAAGFSALLGESPSVVALRRQLEQLVRRYAGARRPPPVLLLGETGTGKSLIARTLHAEGPRAARPFVEVACPAIPETLMESGMFGVERGAFTDARESKPGLFTAADRGTIFLDEVGLLSDVVQAKLLKVVEDQQVRPLGATVSKQVDVWIIAATSEDLEAAVRKRRFREDLYFRLAVVTIRVPPLRERGDDAAVLARHLLARACADYALEPKRFTPDALTALRGHSWPGNIRELGNVIERVALRSESPAVTAADLALAAPQPPPAALRPHREGVAGRGINGAMAVEPNYLTDALAADHGNVTRAARSLGLTRNAFRYRLRKALSAAAARPTAPTPAPATRWERRRVAFLRAVVATAGEETEAQRRGLLHEAVQKIEAFGGTVDAVSPDAVTAVFGLGGLEEGPRHAAHAAMAIGTLVVRSRQFDRGTPVPRMALHVASALLWKGSDRVHVDANARTAIAQALDDLVARAEPGDIVVSEAAAVSLRGAFDVLARDEGRDGASRLVAGERTPDVRPASTPFVGRRDEMGLIMGRLELALAGRGQVVGIDGEPGIGKSRMVFEFHRALGDRAAYVSARSVSYGRDLPLVPVVDLVRRLHGIEDGDTPRAMATKIDAVLATLGMAAADTTPYVLRLLGVAEGTGAIDHIGPDAFRQRMREIFRAIVVASSRLRPLVIAIEDLHWMDRASEGYVASLVDVLDEAPVLLLTTHRPGYQVPWSDRSCVTEVRLQPLVRADARRVLHGVVGGDRLPATVADAILDRADGNPFFIEELARAIDPAAPAPAVPESVEAVLLTRIDRLEAESKGVLQAAAVLGRDVPVPLLEAIVPGVGAPAHLRELERLEYLHDRSDGAGRQYRFKHALTQEVAYASVLPADRRDLHARAVAALEAQHAGRLDEHTATLAHHAVRGQLWEKAVRYLRQTGVKAAARSASHEAVACLEQAVAILDAQPAPAGLDAIDLRLELFRPLVALSEYRRSLDRVVQAAKLAEARGERARLAQALGNQCLMLRIMGFTDDAIEPGRRALAIAKAIGNVPLAGSTNWALGTAYVTNGQLREAVACYRAAITPREGTMHFFESPARGWLAWALELLGQFREAIPLAREAVEIAIAGGNRFGEAGNGCLFGMVYLGLGEWENAIGVLESARAVSRSYDVRDWLGIIAMRLGYAYVRTGRVDEGLALMQEGAAHCEAIDQMTNYPDRLATLGECYLVAGRRADAEATARRALEMAIKQRRPVDEACCRRVLGVILAADASDISPAATCFQQAGALAASLEMRPLVAHCHRDLGTLYARAGKQSEAREEIAAARGLYREMGMSSWLERLSAETTALGLPV